MNTNRCIVLVGTNVPPYTALRMAGEALAELDTTLQSLPEALTIDTRHPEKPSYLNRLYLLHTPLSAEELTARFKALETQLGRMPDDKTTGRVVIDIDLVWFNDRLLKPVEAQHPYVREGVKQF